MRVIARRGTTAYLISLENDPAQAMEGPCPQGRVLDLDQRVLFAPFNIHSILSRGGWIEAQMSLADLEKLLEGVEIQGPPPDIREEPALTATAG